MTKLRARWFLHLLALVLVSQNLGCGSGSDVELAKVTGVVTQNGNPLPDAWVEFLPDFDARPAVARTDKDGRFELTYGAKGNGAVVGTYKVRVGIGGTLDPKDPSGRTDIPKVTLLEQPNQEVSPGANELDFEVPAPKK